MNCATKEMTFRYSENKQSLKQLIIILVDTMPVSKTN